LEDGPVASAPTLSAAGSFSLNLLNELAPPENPNPQRTAEGRLDNDSPEQDEIIGAIRGTVTNKPLAPRSVPHKFASSCPTAKR
jgi:hypothetical protein